MNNEDNYNEQYREFKINTINSWIVFGLLIDIGLVLKEFFNIEVYFKSAALRILVFFIIPFIIGIIKVVYIDPFFDKISGKIKWGFVFVVVGVLIFMGGYSIISNKIL